jgi:hypothetical protein
MFSKRSLWVVILMAAFALLIGSTVLADDEDGRINRAPYHFGGDTLYCDKIDGCYLLDKTGHELAYWSQDDVATALSKADKSGQKLMVDGEGEGTYGPMQLWAMPGKTTNGNSTLCMVGFDEWGKQNDMCFQVTQDWNYEQAPLPAVEDVEAENACDQWSVGDTVYLISDPKKFGAITSINMETGTVTFGMSLTLTFAPASYTAKCSEVAPQVV